MSPRISCVLGDGLELHSIVEIRAMPTIPGPRISPIRHEYIAEAIQKYIDTDTQQRLTDSMHAITENAAKYFGLFDVKTEMAKDFRWVIAATNAIDGTGSVMLHSGIVLPEVEMAIAFHHSEVVVKRTGYLPQDELDILVNETLLKLRGHFNLAFERMDHLKSCKLTSATSAELVMALLGTEVIAGRLAHEFILAWKKPPFEYIKPRNMWSLFCLCAWFLKRLRAKVLLERTQDLHSFFDDMSKFDKKPTRWVQATFA